MEPKARVISFGPFRLDQWSGCLAHGQTKVPLRLKSFAVLEYLVARPGRLVTKDELLDAVWPDTHVTPSVLTGCIRELRRVLNDDARSARFIETAHRRGYRFVAPLESADVGITAELESSDRDSMIAALAHRIAEAVVSLVDLGRPRRVAAADDAETPAPISVRASVARLARRRGLQSVRRKASRAAFSRSESSLKRRRAPRA